MITRLAIQNFRGLKGRLIGPGFGSIGFDTRFVPMVPLAANQLGPPG
jgi:hypothetical protein